MLESRQARTIAEAVWGWGGTDGYRTNRQGAFYYTTSGHGGFVIDVACLTPEELEAIKPYVTIETAVLYQGGRRAVLVHPYRRKPAYITAAHTVRTEIKFILLEEDCDWCLAYMFTGIRHVENPIPMEAAEATFNTWFKNRERAA